MRLLITGSSGLIGTALVPYLKDARHDMVRLVRGETTGDDVRWDPDQGTMDVRQLERVDGVVHLAGENLVGKWTEAKKRRIHESRVNGTRLLCRALAQLDRPPEVLVCASAIGFYGDRGDEELDEDCPPGEGFLPDVCQEWEAATQPARNAGIRVVNLRIGIVLTPAGGALAKMLGPFKAGLGGRLGSGAQWQSWIALDDVLGAVRFALAAEDMIGPINLVAPNPVTQADFARTLGKVLRRPALAAMPAFGARLAFGEMADEMLLASTRVVPKRLVEAGYAFRHDELEPTLRHLLEKEPHR